MTDRQRQAGGELLERTKETTKEPDLYKVILHNDDYTTMDFVVHVLQSVFQKSAAQAFRIMMQVHTQGQGLAGVYTHEIAETKAATVQELAREHGFPLLATVELE